VVPGRWHGCIPHRPGRSLLWSRLAGSALPQKGFFQVSFVAPSTCGEFTPRKGISPPPDSETAAAELPACLGTGWPSLAPLAVGNFADPLVPSPQHLLNAERFRAASRFPGEAPLGLRGFSLPAALVFAASRGRGSSSGAACAGMLGAGVAGSRCRLLCCGIREFTPGPRWAQCPAEDRAVPSVGGFPGWAGDVASFLAPWNGPFL